MFNFFGCSLYQDALLKDGDELGQVTLFYLLSKCVIEVNIVPITGSMFNFSKKVKFAASVADP
jgi:hypothetical protein